MAGHLFKLRVGAYEVLVGSVSTSKFKMYSLNKWTNLVLHKMPRHFSPSAKTKKKCCPL